MTGPFQRLRRRRAPSPPAPVDALDGQVRAQLEHELGRGAPAGWFEAAYRRCHDDGVGLPWVHATPHPYLLDWLAAPVTSPPGARAVVVGCGLGDDAQAVADAGYEVTAIDVAPTALAWAAARFPDAVRWREADLLALPEDLVEAFDLVVEVHTVPWLPGVVRDAAMVAVGRLARPGGIVLAVTLLGRDQAALEAAGGPPWPQAPSELATYRAANLVRVALEHPGPEAGPVYEARVTFQRPHGTPPARDGLPLVPGG